MIAHRLATIRHADRIVVVTAAGVLEEGPHQQRYAARRAYRTLYDGQFAHMASNGRFGARADHKTPALRSATAFLANFRAPG